jgi:oxygen-independent coproporphyrinogen-3 oxidase
MSSLYVHIPFCLRKCPYCDFFSRPLDPVQLSTFPDLLIAHLEQEKSRDRWQGPFSTVFFGGGTPSLLPPAAIGRILQRAARLFGLAPDAEITMEANPGTVTGERLHGYRSAGVNRLSFGVQSLNDDHLKRLGRVHSAADARRAVAWARRAGFDNLGLDLIFALPDQPPQRALADLEEFLHLDPEHLSCYGLGIEPDTPFARQLSTGELLPAAEEDYAETFLLLHDRLTAAGFDHYEISNYARPERRCLHNLQTWQRQPYLGIGPGAHSFCAREWGERRSVPPDFDAYEKALAMGADPTVLLESFDREGAMAETAYLGLRYSEGVDDLAFSRRFGCRFATVFAEAIARCKDRLALQRGRWRLDLQGWLLFDHFIRHFL